MSRLSSFDAKDYSIDSFIRDRAPSLFKVPDYQRRFVWETKPLIDFLDAIIKNLPGYYIGSFVIVRPEDRSYDLEVIDGQQRLTTLTFTIKVLLDILEEGDMELTKDQREFCDYLLFRNSEPRMVFSDAFFNNHFRTLLQEKNPLRIPELQTWFREIESESESKGGNFKKERMLASRKAVARLFATYKDIQKYFQDYQLEEIKEVIERVRNLQLIEIVCKDISIVNDLFEGLNSKGVQLTIAEQIKSRLFGKINSLNINLEAQNSLKATWEDMDLLFFVEEDKRLIDKFLRHLWISKRGYISGNKLYDEYVDTISKLKNEEDVRKFVDELREYSDYYLAIRSISFSRATHGVLMDELVYEKFNDFGRLNNEQIYEVLLRLIRLIKSDPGKQLLATRDLKLILANLWAFCFRLQFIPVSPSKYENRFADLCTSISRWVEESKPLASECFLFIKDALAPYVKDSALLVDNISTQLVYKNSWQNNRMLEKIFYDIFFTYDQSTPHKRNTLAYVKPTIEHILPQKCDEWNYKKVEVSGFVNNIGNLTMLDEVENIKAANHPFKFKLENVYSVNAFKINQDLKEYSAGYETSDLITLNRTIERRATQLAELLDESYKL